MIKNYIGILSGLVLGVLPSCGNQLQNKSKVISSGKYSGRIKCNSIQDIDGSSKVDSFVLDINVSIGNSGLPIVKGQEISKGGLPYFEFNEEDFISPGGQYDSITVGNFSYFTSSSGSIYYGVYDDFIGLNFIAKENCMQGSFDGPMACETQFVGNGSHNGMPSFLEIICHDNLIKQWQ